MTSKKWIREQFSLALSYIEAYLLEEDGFRIQTNQSPYSDSSYIQIQNFEAKKEATIRVSDHHFSEYHNVSEVGEWEDLKVCVHFGNGTNAERAVWRVLSFFKLKLHTLKDYNYISHKYSESKKELSRFNLLYELESHKAKYNALLEKLNEEVYEWEERKKEERVKFLMNNYDNKDFLSYDEFCKQVKLNGS